MDKQQEYQTKQRNKAIPAVYLLLEKEGKILLARRCNTGYQDGNYNLPSGHAELSELPRQAMVREAKEEINISLMEDDLEFVHASYRPKHDATGDRADYFFRARRWSGEIVNCEPNKCDKLTWVDPNNLPENVSPHNRNAIKCVLKGVIFSELGIDFLKKEGVYMLDN